MSTPQAVRTKVEVLGDIRTIVAGRPVQLSDAMRRLLVGLVVAGPTGLPDDQLAAQVWHDVLPSTWPASLRMAISRLRGRGVAVDRLGQRYAFGSDVLVDLWIASDTLNNEAWVPSLQEAQSILRPVFGGEELGDALLAKTAILDAREIQVATMNRIGGQPAEAVQPFLPLIRSLLTAVPSPELLLPALRAHIAAGQVVPAFDLYETTLEVTGFDASEVSGLEEIERELLATQAETKIPVELRLARDRELFGRDLELQWALDRLDAGAPVGVRGLAGMGKTRLLAEIAYRRATEGRDVVSAAGGAGSVPYGALVASDLDFRKVIDVESDRLNTESVSARILARFADILSQRSARGTTLLIDDYELLDSRSRLIIDLLVTASANDGGFEVVVAGTEAMPSGLLHTIELEPLADAEIRQMVRALYPERTSTAIANTAREVSKFAAGRPAFFSFLLQELSDSPTTESMLDESQELISLRRHLVTRLSGETLEVGLFAAILGFAFGEGELLTLSGWDETDLTREIDQLVDNDVLVETSVAGGLRFAHELLRKVLLALASSRRRRELHARAARLTDDVHRRAEHLAAAVPDIEPEVARSALLVSAQAALDAGLYLEAKSALERAKTVSDDPLGPEAELLLATALELSGSDVSELRREIFARAAELEDWHSALQAATGGLPFAEPPDGHPERVDLLLRIPAVELRPAERFKHALQSARQLRLIGSDDAAQWIAEANRLSRSREDKAELWLQHVLLELHPTTGVIERPKEFPAALVAQAHEADALRSYRSETVADAREYCVLAKRAADSSGDAVRGWHSRTFEAHLHLEAGDIEAARACAQSAADYGRRHGFQDSDAIELAQLFMIEWVLGRAAALYPFLESVPPDVSQSWLFRAALSVVMDACGDPRSETMAAETASAALAHGGIHTAATLALLSSQISKGTGEIVDSCKALLSEFSGSSLVVGFGVAGLGPVDGLLSRFETDQAVRDRLLRQAIEQADEAGMICWSVKYRVELSDLLGDSSISQAATEIAAGTDLSPILTGDGRS